jgi:hypothetical protein
VPAKASPESIKEAATTANIFRIWFSNRGYFMQDLAAFLLQSFANMIKYIAQDYQSYGFSHLHSERDTLE